jgi:RNA polymerase sigma-70 factor (ECF subfamily)
VPVDADDIAFIDRLAAGDEAGVVTDLLSGLPSDQRALVAARVIDERSYEELAGEHELSQATVRKRVSRGLTALRTRLQEGERTP